MNKHDVYKKTLTDNITTGLSINNYKIVSQNILELAKVVEYDDVIMFTKRDIKRSVNGFKFKIVDDEVFRYSYLERGYYRFGFIDDISRFMLYRREYSICTVIKE